MRLAVFPDFLEEEWFSMDLCAELLTRELENTQWSPQVFLPKFHRLASRMVKGRAGRAAFNMERLWNRFIHYPRAIKRTLNEHGGLSSISDCDAYHVVDHTYAQLVHVLPANRTGVYCHDLDAFRSLLEPENEKRPWWFRRMARRQLSGLQKAGVVFHSTMPVRQRMLELDLVDEKKLIHAPYGIADEFIAASSGSLSTSLSTKLTQSRTLDGGAMPELDKHPWILHVGSAIPRKRIDVLLEVFSKTRAAVPDLKLVKVGGQWTETHLSSIEQLELGRSTVHVKDLNRTELAELYRSASAVLIPSEAEGFGLPVIEAMACGAPVLCSDIPVLREVGGKCAIYARTADIDDWSIKLRQLLEGTLDVPARSDRIAWASGFSWRNHANIIAQAYDELLMRARVEGS